MSERWLERQRREDFRAGQITATLANLLSDRTKHKEAFKPEDFFPLLLDSRFRGNDRVGGNDGDGQGRNAAKAGMTAEQMFDAAKLHHQTIIRSRK